MKVHPSVRDPTAESWFTACEIFPFRYMRGENILRQPVTVSYLVPSFRSSHAYSAAGGKHTGDPTAGMPEARGYTSPRCRQGDLQPAGRPVGQSCQIPVTGLFGRLLVRRRFIDRNGESRAKSASRPFSEWPTIHPEGGRRFPQPRSLGA